MGCKCIGCEFLWVVIKRYLSVVIYQAGVIKRELLIGSYQLGVINQEFLIESCQAVVLNRMCSSKIYKPGVTKWE